MECARRTTTTLHVSLRLLPSVVVAIMLTTPGTWVVTIPLSSTEAIELLLEDHDTFLLVALLGETVAVNWKV